MSLAILVLGGFLGAVGQGLGGQWLALPWVYGGRSPDFDQLVGAVAAAAGLAVVVWWVLSMLCAFLAAALERSGRQRGAARAGGFCPPFMRRLMLAIVSIQLVSTPLAYAAEPVSGPEWGATQQVPVAWEPTAAAAGETAPAAREIDRSAASAVGDPPPPSGVQPQWRPSLQMTDPDFTVVWPVRSWQTPPESPAEITVLAGDTLWDIAARHLGPAASDVDVALHWPRWYQANKAKIGENPDVLLPGQVLKPPAAA
ncbi:MAG TPA: LysM domain-containing protein [Arthrobacter sp.]|nr:LysM domain-containing protein [Arthrobacter sp.]